MGLVFSNAFEVEAIVEQLVHEASDRSSLSAIGRDKYWDRDIRYHLCPERSHLFRHLNLSGLDVLEFGAEMGGASRYLAEQARSLVSVESNETYFRVLSKRLSDLPNWTGVASEFGEFGTDKKFDVVCLVGPLEQTAPLAVLDPAQCQLTSLLGHATNFLKPDGVLLVAIENRYGIKYWAGAPVEHSGRMFDGICGYSTEEYPAAISRLRLLEILDAKGIREAEEFYPWPDYKMPQSVISKALVDRFPELAADIAADAITRDPNPSIQYFPTSIAARHAIADGRITDISNSFFFVGSPRADSPTLNHVLAKTRKDKEAAWHYSSLRHSPISTAFTIENASERPTVLKRNLGNEAAWESRLIQWRRPERTPVLSGAKVSHLLQRAAYYRGQQAYEELLVDYLKATIVRFRIDGGRLLPEAYDAVPHNAVQPDGGGYDHFDLEWALRSPMRKDWLVLRTVLCEPPSLKALPAGTYNSLGELFDILCSKLGLDSDREQVSLREAEVQQDIGAALPAKELQAYYLGLLAEPIGSDMFPRSPSLEGYLRSAVTKDNVGQKLHELQNEVDALRSIVNRRSVRFVLSAAKRLKKLKIWPLSVAPLILSDAILNLHL
jgi:SAM-dependent methyltransferase